MKTLIFKNWMTALLLTGACCGLVACDNDDEGNKPIPADVTEVIGAYNGEMSVFRIVPINGEDEAPVGAQVDATITSEAVLFEDFPIRDLVINVIGDETLADQIVAKIGKVDYSIPYTAQMSESKTNVNLKLVPEPLKLKLSNDSENSEPESLEEPSSLEIEVDIIAEGDGAYTIESKNMEFRISAASVTLNGNKYTSFKPFTLAFDLNKN